MRVAELMPRAVATVNPGALVDEIAQLLVDRHINGVPVVDDAGRLAGIVTSGDLLHRAADEHPIDRSSGWKENLRRRTAQRKHPEQDRPTGAPLRR